MLKKYLENGTEQDIDVLKYVMSGLKDKVDGKISTYIGGLLHYEKISNQNVWEVTIPINPVLYNSLGIVHGGITATLLDSGMGTLANALVPKGFGAVTSQLNVHYLAPAMGDFLRCRAEAIHIGKNTLVVSGEVFRSDGKKVAHSTGTFFIVENNPGSGE
ncbi:thioesterase [Bacillus sp. FJAT-27225]|nr:thioesterase [Bacillus sp. FJAT-27225]